MFLSFGKPFLLLLSLFFSCASLNARPWDEGLAEGGQYVSLVILLTGFLLSLAYMLSQIFNSAEVKAKVKTYFMHYFVSILLVIGAVGLLVVSDSFVQAFAEASSSLTPIEISRTYYKVLLNGGTLSCSSSGRSITIHGAIPIFYMLVQRSFHHQIQATDFIFLDIGIPFFFGGSGHAPNAHERAYARVQDLTVDLLMAGTMSLYVQLVAATYIETLVKYLFPIALAFRIFPPTRQVGDFLFSVVVAAVILFPLFTIAFMKSVACADYSSISFAPGMESDPTGLPFRDIAILIPQMTFFPGLLFVLLSTFVMVTMKTLSRV